MDTYEILSVLFLGGTFLFALLTYIDRDHSVNKTPTFVLGLVQGRHFVAL